MVNKDEDLDWTSEFSNMEFIGVSDKSSFSKVVQGKNGFEKEWKKNNQRHKYKLVFWGVLWLKKKGGRENRVAGKRKCWSRFFDQPTWFYVNGNDTIKRKRILEKKQGLEMLGNILTVTVEIRASVQTWSSHILESRLLLIDRCLENILLFWLSFTEGK